MTTLEQAGTSVTFTIQSGSYPVFYRILQAGFAMGCLPGCSVRSFLCDELGIGAEYVDSRISTVFLNGMPVDDLDAALLDHGSRLSLSGALPGLVGATMRKGGAYASFRDSISYRGTGICRKGGTGTIRLKLFNMVMEEIGPLLLARGILIMKRDLEEIVTNGPDGFLPGPFCLSIDGRLAGFEELASLLAGTGDGAILLRVAVLAEPAAAEDRCRDH